MRFSTREAKELRGQSRALRAPLLSQRRREESPSPDLAASQSQVASAVQRSKTNPHQLSGQDVLLLQSALGNRKTAALLGRGQPTMPPTQAPGGQAATGAALGGFVPDLDGPGQEPDAVLGGVAPSANLSSVVSRDDTTSATMTATPAATTTASPSATSISSTTKSGPTWGANGKFDWRVGFGTSGRSGWIVQEIVNTYDAKDASGGSIGTGVTPHYWEAWSVSDAGAVAPIRDGVNDFWLRPNKGASTEGEWTMSGNLFFTTTDPATQGFTPGGVSNAGILLSTTSQPTGLGSVLLTRQANGKWDTIATTPVPHAGTAG